MPLLLPWLDVDIDIDIVISKGVVRSWVLSKPNSSHLLLLPTTDGAEFLIGLSDNGSVSASTDGSVLIINGSQCELDVFDDFHLHCFTWKAGGSFKVHHFYHYLSVITYWDVFITLLIYHLSSVMIHTYLYVPVNSRPCLWSVITLTLTATMIIISLLVISIMFIILIIHQCANLSLVFGERLEISSRLMILTTLVVHRHGDCRWAQTVLWNTCTQYYSSVWDYSRLPSKSG